MPGTAGHAEGCDLPLFHFRQFGEEGIIGGIGANPAAFHVINAQQVKLLGDGGLVVDAEIHTLSLGAVTQGAIIEIDSLVAHNRACGLKLFVALARAAPSGASCPIFKHHARLCKLVADAV